MVSNTWEAGMHYMTYNVMIYSYFIKTKIVELEGSTIAGT